MNAIKRVSTFLLRLAVVWVIDIISLLVTAEILPGFTIAATESQSVLTIAAAAALLLGIVNLLLRPLILLLTLPFGFIAVFVIGFFVNTLVLLLTANLLDGFTIESVLTAFIGSIIISAVNAVITAVVTIDDDDSFYQGVVERLAARTSFSEPEDETQGLIMMEIDGLSYWHLQKALDEGYLPTMKEMMDEEGYELSRIDCGLPSQTSACQAGIMFGDNYDIPAFRWYDKDQGRLLVSGHDATEINARYAKGNGLMRGGSSINNMMNGDAEKSLLTLADIRGGSDEENKRRAEDIYLLMLNPYFLTRTIALFIGDVLVELWQGWQQRRKDIQPRLNRLHGGYPFIRAATTVLMRDVSAYLTILDIIRGTPALYVTWPGYDEVAHHSGPWTDDAFKVLGKYDAVIARVRDIIDRKAPRPYELVLLSDHGQSFGATFKQRYGYDLKTFIETNLPSDTSIVQTAGGDDGTLSVRAMSGELDNMQEQGMGNRFSKAAVKRTQRTLDNQAEKSSSDLPVQPAQVTVCGSGNLAQVYFDLYPRKIALNELNAAYPGVVDALVQHEGVGFVVGYDDDGTPIALGKAGSRNLHTNEVTGDDPFIPYGDVDLRAQQVRRIADFPHAGDLIINSTFYADGTVAAMEELVGNHGGMGGEQTDAFLFHPAHMEVPETLNSADVFHILNARRDVVADEKKAVPERPAKSQELNAWSWAVLSKGLSQVNVWAGLALRAMILDRSAYREIAKNAYMTGPAILIAVITLLTSSLISSKTAEPRDALLSILFWPIAVLMVFAAGRILGGKGSYTTTLRTLGFAQAALLYELIGLIPALEPLARFITVAVSFVAVWMAGVEAHKLKGWRSMIFPIVAVVIPVIAIVILGNLLEGAVVTIDTLLQSLGLAP